MTGVQTCALPIYLKYVTEQAKNYGLVPFVWDNGATDMCIIKRVTLSSDEQMLEALVKGAQSGNYPF